MSFDRQPVVLSNVAEGTQSKNSAIEFRRARATEGIRTYGAAASLQSLRRAFNSFGTFLIFFLLAGVITHLEPLQAHPFALFPQEVTLVLTEAGGTNAAQVLYVAWTPEIEHRVIANDACTGDRLELS